LSHVLSADWVLPIEGPPIENGAVEIETDGATLSITTWADRRRESFDLSSSY